VARSRRALLLWDVLGLEDLVAVGLTDESLCHYECCGRKKQEVRKRRKKTKKRGTYKMGKKKREVRGPG
jgi:hypothetical protein